MAITRLVARVFSILLCLSGLTITPTAGLVVAYQLAKITPRIGMLVIEACLVCFLFTLAASTLTVRLWPNDLRKFPLGYSAIVTGLFGLVLFLTVLRPMHYPHLGPVARANTQYWNLPTGYCIAYSVFEPPCRRARKGRPDRICAWRAGFSRVRYGPWLLPPIHSGWFSCLSVRSGWLRFVRSPAPRNGLHSGMSGCRLGGNPPTNWR